MMDDNEREKRAADVWVLAFQYELVDHGIDMACNRADEAARRFRVHFLKLATGER